jgi:hypothetical protein
MFELREILSDALHGVAHVMTRPEPPLACCQPAKLVIGHATIIMALQIRQQREQRSDFST